MAAHIQAVDRALRILETTAAAGTPLSLAEMSQRVGLHVSTTHRLLATMRARGFIERDAESGRYRIGVQAFRVGSAFAEDTDLRPRLHPMLTRLAARSGETANLVIRRGLEAVYIDHVIGTQVAKLFTEIGQRVPLHCTAVGKVLLASGPGEDGDLVRGLTLAAWTIHTITSRRALQRELATIRAAGYAIDREEHELGVGCVAAPVRDATGAVVAAIGISGPSGRVLSAVTALSEHVRAAAAEASRALGSADPRSRSSPVAGRCRPGRL